MTVVTVLGQLLLSGRSTPVRAAPGPLPVVAKPAVATPTVAKPAAAKPAVAKPPIAKPPVAKPAVLGPLPPQPAQPRPAVAKPPVAAKAPVGAASRPPVARPAGPLPKPGPLTPTAATVARPVTPGLGAPKPPVVVKGLPVAPRPPLPRPATTTVSAVQRPPGVPGRAPEKPGPGPRLLPSLRFTIEPYLQDVKTDGIVIAWSTDVASAGVVRIAAPSRPLKRPAYTGELPTETTSPGETVETETPGPVFLSPPSLHHKVRISGLRSGTRYRYVVAVRRPGDTAGGSSEVQSSPAEFATAPDNGPFVFLVYGDNRDRDGDHAAVVRAMATEQPDLILQTGDMISRANDEAQWRRYFATASPLMRSAPMYPVLGNHELRGDPEAAHFARFFVMPGEYRGSARRRPVYYAFRYSNSLFLALDGNSPYDNDQANWLERTLQNAQSDSSLRHIFAFVHQPPYAVGTYCGSERLQRRIVPILLRYPIRAVFGGHEHAYQHLNRQGIQYFVSGGGGAPLYPRSQPCTPEDDMALRMFRAEHHYLRVQIDGEQVMLTAIDKHGRLIERVDLQSAPDAPATPLPGPVLSANGAPPRPLPTGEPLRVASLSPPSTAMLPPLLPIANAQPAAVSASPPSRGPLLLLWLSCMVMLAGLLVLTSPGQRRRRSRVTALPRSPA